MITQAALKEQLRYEPDTGRFVWLVSRPGVKAGTRAGNKKPNGYWQITIDRKNYAAARLAWLYVHGELPETIDHINCNPSDNRIVNLRPATYAQQAGNKRIFRNNTSGYKGVTYDRGRGHWKAYIYIGSRRKHLGVFDDPVEASRAYEAAAREHFGTYARVS